MNIEFVPQLCTTLLGSLAIESFYRSLKKAAAKLLSTTKSPNASSSWETKATNSATLRVWSWPTRISKTNAKFSLTFWKRSSRILGGNNDFSSGNWRNTERSTLWQQSPTTRSPHSNKKLTSWRWAFHPLNGQWYICQSWPGFVVETARGRHWHFPTFKFTKNMTTLQIQR